MNQTHIHAAKFHLSVQKNGDSWCAMAKGSDCVGMGATRESALENLMFSICSTLCSRAFVAVEQQIAEANEETSARPFDASWAVRPERHEFAVAV